MCVAKNHKRKLHRVPRKESRNNWPKIRISFLNVEPNVMWSGKTKMTCSFLKTFVIKTFRQVETDCKFYLTVFLFNTEINNKETCVVLIQKRTQILKNRTTHTAILQHYYYLWWCYFIMIDITQKVARKWYVRSSHDIKALICDWC